MKRFVWLFLFLTACGAEFRDPTDVTVTKVETFATDEVKLIDSAVTDLLAPGTYRSYQYTVSPTSRLLLRLGSLKALVNEILDEQPILVRITPVAGEREVAESNLRLCALENNWMMHATWLRAHPYRGGTWHSPGGDIFWEDCLAPLPAESPIFSQTEEADFCDNTQSLCFDIKSHFKVYVRSRGINYGWALVNESNQVVRILGDRSPLGPEVFYRRFR